MNDILFRGKRFVGGEWAYGSFYRVKNAFNEKHILHIISDVHWNEWRRSDENGMDTV